MTEKQRKRDREKERLGNVVEARKIGTEKLILGAELYTQPNQTKTTKTTIHTHFGKALWFLIRKDKNDVCGKSLTDTQIFAHTIHKRNETQPKKEKRKTKRKSERDR